jgi:hypothetical protein
MPPPAATTPPARLRVERHRAPGRLIWHVRCGRGGVPAYRHAARYCEQTRLATERRGARPQAGSPGALRSGTGHAHGADSQAAVLGAHTGGGGGGCLAGAPRLCFKAVPSPWPRSPALGSPAGGLAAAYCNPGGGRHPITVRGGRYRLGLQEANGALPLPLVVAVILRRSPAELRRAPKPCLHERQAGVISTWPEKSWWVLLVWQIGCIHG